MNEEKVIKIVKEYLEKQFPKTCLNCGRVFPSYAEYLQNTTQVGDPVSYDEDMDNLQPKTPLGTFAFRNCKCGSTLSLSSNDMNRLTLFRLMMWVRVEAKERGVTVKELFRHLRSELCRRGLGESEKD